MSLEFEQVENEDFYWFVAIDTKNGGNDELYFDCEKWAINEFEALKTNENVVSMELVRTTHDDNEETIRRFKR